METMVQSMGQPWELTDHGELGMAYSFDGVDDWIKQCPSFFNYNEFVS